MVSWVEEALKEKNRTILPPKISMKPEEGVFYNVMPAILCRNKIAGVKVVTRYPNRVPSLNSEILLYNLVTGEPLSLMDGNFITTARTGAVAVHSIKLFAKKDFNVISFIGLGNQARATLSILLEEFPEKEFVFKLFKYKDQAEKFANYINSLTKNNHKIIISENYDDTIAGSDVVISSATYFEGDIVSNTDIFQPGCLLIPIHTRGFMNCDKVFDKVYADDTAHVKNFKYFEDFKFFREVSDVMKNKELGRQNDIERIIVYNIGLALHDINFSGHIYFEKLHSTDLPSVNLGSPVEKFWF